MSRKRWIISYLGLDESGIRTFKIRAPEQKEYEAEQVWYSNGRVRCVGCSGPLSAMLSTCEHANAVRRAIRAGKFPDVPPLPVAGQRHRSVPPASAPAATAGTDVKWRAVFAHDRWYLWRGEPKGQFIEWDTVGEIEIADTRAPTGEEAETKLTEADRDVLHRLAELHPEYSVRLRAIAYHYPMVRKMVEDSASDLAAQATELAALRARVEEIEALLTAFVAWDDDDDEDTPNRWDSLDTLCNSARAALAPRQPNSTAEAVK